nr:thiosulfate oxidation carrier protein SoxY [sulfur-oxidizing endosymbiont of Gigantopelta aegis]
MLKNASKAKRLFLKSSLSASVITIAIGAGFLTPMRALATWNEAAFKTNNLPTAIKSALGSDLSEASNKITIKAPDIAENGTLVPVTVSSSLEDVSAITLFSEKNNAPLVAQFELDKDCDAFIATRIKMNMTSNVIAIVTAKGKHYSTRKEVKVTLGGCGA